MMNIYIDIYRYLKNSVNIFKYIYIYCPSPRERSINCFCKFT